MATKTGELKFIISVDSKTGKTRIDEIGKSVNGLSKKVKKETKEMGSSFSGMWKQMAVGQVAFNLIASGLREVNEFLKVSIQTAIDAEEATSKFYTIFADVAKEASDSAKDLAENWGLSKKSAEEMLSGTGDLLTGLGMTSDSALTLSERTQQLAVDLASFQNFAGGAKGASEALTKGLLGEREMLKSLGIVINEKMLKDELMTKGMEDLTGMARLQARANITLELAIQQSKNAVGDFARTADSTANRQKILQNRTEDLQQAIGERLVPAFNELLNLKFEALEGLSKMIEENKEDIDSFVSSIIDAVKAVRSLDDLIPDIVKENFTASGVLKKTAKNFADVTNIIKVSINPWKNLIKQTKDFRAEEKKLRETAGKQTESIKSKLELVFDIMEKNNVADSVFRDIKNGQVELHKQYSMLTDSAGNYLANLEKIKKGDYGPEAARAVRIMQESFRKDKIGEVAAEIEKVAVATAKVTTVTPEAAAAAKTHAKELAKIQKEFEKLNKEVPIFAGEIFNAKEVQDDFIDSADEVVKSVLDESEEINILTEETQAQNEAVRAAVEKNEELKDSYMKTANVISLAANLFGQVNDLLIETGIISDDSSNRLNRFASEAIKAAKGAATFYEGLATEDPSKMAGGAMEFLTSATTAIATAFSTVSKEIQEAIDKEKEFIELSKDMESQVAKMAKILGDTHLATSAMLADIIKEATITNDNIEGYWKRAREILSDYQRGAIDATQATKGMGETFAELVKEAKRLGTEGSKAMIQFILDSKAAGLNIKEVADYIKEKLNTGVDALNRRLKTLASGGKLLKGEFGRLSRFTRDMFNALISEGADYIDVVAQMQDSLLSLSALAEEKGKKIKGDLADMIDLAKFLDANKLLIDKIKDTKIMMDALAHAGKLTGESFGDFQTSAKRQFDELIKRELSTEDALRLMMPTLRDLQKMADTYGLTLDATTQAMIDQAKEAGLSFEAQKTDAEIQTDLMQQQLDVLKAIAKAFRVDIPDGIDATTGAVQGMAQAVADVDWEQFYKDRGFGTGGGHIPGGGPGDFKPPGFANGTNGFITPPPAFVVGEDSPEFMEMRGGKMKVTPMGRGNNFSDAAPQAGPTFITNITMPNLKVNNKADKDATVKAIKSVVDGNYRNITRYLGDKVSHGTLRNSL